MAINSKAKGKRGEIEIVRMLREYGYDCRRGQQYCGANGDADVVGLPGLHLEIKRVEKLNVENALRQAEADAKAGEIPVVMHRANREEWKVTMRLDDFMCQFCKALDKAGIAPVCATDCERREKE
jgi:Holliday junction resolvase